MKEIISRELLGEVLGFEVLWYEQEENQLKIGFRSYNPIDENDGGVIWFNIYELAHKCKEKAREYGFSITTGNRVDGTDRYDVLCIHKDEDIECGEAVFFNEIVDTEPNGIFMAMQWILDNQK